MATYMIEQTETAVILWTGEATSEEAEVTDPLGLLLTLLEARGAVLP